MTTTEVGAKNLECSEMKFYWLLNMDFSTIHPIRSRASRLGKTCVIVVVTITILS